LTEKRKENLKKRTCCLSKPSLYQKGEGGENKGEGVDMYSRVGETKKQQLPEETGSGRGGWVTRTIVADD